MGRALMIPGMVGKNIGMWLEQDDLPKTVAKYGTKVEEIFVTYEELKNEYGAEVDEIPLGAMGIYTYCQRFRAGLQQLMAGSRNFSLSAISRSDLMALTEESAQVTGIPYVMEAYREEAYDILDDVGSFEREGGVIPLGEPTAVLRILREGARRQRSSRLS
jgi:hypothetical protein